MIIYLRFTPTLTLCVFMTIRKHVHQCNSMAYGSVTDRLGQLWSSMAQS